MVVLEFEDVEVDYCVVCEGLWLDEGELELLFGSREMSTDFMTAGSRRKATGEKPRRCPICGKKMAKEVTAGTDAVVYDRCTRGHGLWFDAGELATVLEHGSAAPGGEEVARLLRAMFGGADPAPGSGDASGTVAPPSVPRENEAEPEKEGGT